MYALNTIRQISITLVKEYIAARKITFGSRLMLNLSTLFFFLDTEKPRALWLATFLSGLYDSTFRKVTPIDEDGGRSHKYDSVNIDSIEGVRDFWVCFGADGASS